VNMPKSRLDSTALGNILSMSDDPFVETNENLAVSPPSIELTAPDPTLRGDVAVKAILLRLLDELEANEVGVLQNENPECLHDFRIAVRRTRSALGQIKDVFTDRTVQRFAPRFAWLGNITSPPRDFEVYLLGFDELKAELPELFQGNIDPLRGFLENHCDLAHGELTRQIHSARYRALLADWRKFLLASCPKNPQPPHALTPIKEIADLRIWKLFRRVLKQGRGIRSDTPAENIHELRKTCKKLRYLLEFFGDLYPQEAVGRPIKQLKKLQNYLGDFQDVHARIAMLHGICHKMRKDTTVPTEALLALGGLLADLNNRQSKLRKEFSDHFRPFANVRNRERFRELFKPSLEKKAGVESD
jgi:CHAD domain-containing protein